MRFIGNNLAEFGLAYENVHVITEGHVNEALFDMFFTVMDLSILQVPFVNYFVHHQSVRSEEVLMDTPWETFEKLFAATGNFIKYNKRQSEKG